MTVEITRGTQEPVKSPNTIRAAILNEQSFDGLGQKEHPNLHTLGPMNRSIESPGTEDSSASNTVSIPQKSVCQTGIGQDIFIPQKAASTGQAQKRLWVFWGYF
jgi:hypothetical protein